jgi:hypothetical protein
MSLRPNSNLSASRDNVPALAATRIVSPAPRDVWQRILAADPNAVATQTPEWVDGLCSARGYVDASRLYELPDGRSLILPLAAKTCSGVRITEESWPYGWGYGGALVAGGHLTVPDVRLMLADLARRPIIRAAVVPMPLTGTVWAAAAPRATHRVRYLTQVVDLDGGFDTVWSKRYKKETRWKVRKAKRSSLEIRRDHGGSALDVFAGLYRQAVDRWAHRSGHPLWVAHLLERRRDHAGRVAAASAALGEACVIWSAHRAGEPVAVAVVLQYGQHSMLWLAAVKRELARETMAGHLLQSMVIEDACKLGARYFHMGESEAGSGLEQYKASFGATPVEYQALRFERLPLTDAERRLRATVKRMTDRRRLRLNAGSGSLQR